MMGSATFADVLRTCLSIRYHQGLPSRLYLALPYFQPFLSDHKEPFKLVEWLPIYTYIYIHKWNGSYQE